MARKPNELVNHYIYIYIYIYVVYIFGEAHTRLTYKACFVTEESNQNNNMLKIYGKYLKFIQAI